MVKAEREIVQKKFKYKIFQPKKGASSKVDTSVTACPQ